MDTPPAPLLTTKDVSRRLNLGVRTVVEMIERDGLPARRVGGVYRFEADEVEAWLAARDTRRSA